ncbi:uncharacterized protein LOC116611890 [Nematostella vectensis]|uniref:uncharacterized protein LOC116611890 n=1 Tax=Nematostella vectensis TaxID=45351 RepID=UPI0020771AA7|nr:uncharacterized protein LOC116611890 [Nematostella vectensis]
MNWFVVLCPFICFKYITFTNGDNVVSKITAGEVLAKFNHGINNISLSDLARKTSGLLAARFENFFGPMRPEVFQTMEKATLLQISVACGITNSQLISMTLPDISRSVFGSTVVPAPCLILVREKGVAISALGVSSPGAKTALLLLLAATGQKWRQARLTESLELADWDILDSVTVDEFSQIANMTNLLSGSVSDLIAQIKSRNLVMEKNNHALKTRLFLENFFNLSLENALTINGGRLDAMTLRSARLVEIFINATVSYFEITLSDIYCKLNVSMKELLTMNVYEIQEILPHLISASVALQAARHNITQDEVYVLMNISPTDGTVSLLKKGLYKLKDHLKKKTSITQLKEMTVLDMIQMASESSEVENWDAVLGFSLEVKSILREVKVIDIPLYIEKAKQVNRGYQPISYWSILGFQVPPQDDPHGRQSFSGDHMLVGIVRASALVILAVFLAVVYRQVFVSKGESHSSAIV